MKNLTLIVFIFFILSVQPHAQHVQGCGTIISQIECTYFKFQDLNCKLNLADSISFPSDTYFYIEGTLRLNCNEQFCPFTPVPHCIDVDYITVCDTIPDCESQMPGDADGSGFVDIADITFLMNVIYSSAVLSIPSNGDANGDCRVNIGDVIYLSAYIEGGPAPVECTCNDPVMGEDGCCFDIRGNVNYDPQDLIDIADLVEMAFRMFGDGPAPICPEELDVNDDNFSGSFDIGDLVFLVEFMFGGGPAPDSCY